MTREEAVEIIKSECYVFNPLNFDKTTLINTALDMAVESLETIDEDCENYGYKIGFSKGHASGFNVGYADGRERAINNTYGVPFGIYGMCSAGSFDIDAMKRKYTAAMKDIEKNHGDDPEMSHYYADMLMVDILEQMGFDMTAYNSMTRWYA